MHLPQHVICCAVALRLNPRLDRVCLYSFPPTIKPIWNTSCSFLAVSLSHTLCAHCAALKIVHYRCWTPVSSVRDLRFLLPNDIAHSIKTNARINKAQQSHRDSRAAYDAFGDAVVVASRRQKTTTTKRPRELFDGRNAMKSTRRRTIFSIRVYLLERVYAIFFTNDSRRGRRYMNGLRCFVDRV